VVATGSPPVLWVRDTGGRMTDRSGPCVVCASLIGKVLFSGTDHREGLGGRFEVVRCAQCGLVRTEPRPEDLSAWYPATYQQHVGAEGLTVRAVAAAARKTSRASGVTGFSALLERLVPDADFGGPVQGLRVLDAGAGNGNIVRALLSSGVDAHGIEPSSQAVDAAHGRGATTVRLGTLDDERPAVDGRFDLVRFYQVLEHVPDPVATLRRARSLLAPGGRIVVGVPNFGGAGARLLRSSWDGLELPRHLHHFTPASLRAVLSAAGLQTTRVRTVAVFGVLPASIDARTHRGLRQSGWGRSLVLRGLVYPVELGLAVTGFGDGIMAVAVAGDRV
jgi:2-polyprenyl-3-methyl-5-hydroxy-6-metoxy-1,4-benzoquinol methylase